jgi:hypothetical protein
MAIRVEWTVQNATAGRDTAKSDNKKVMSAESA